MHVVQHELGAGNRVLAHPLPNLLISGMAKEPHAYDDVSREREVLVCLLELAPEARAPAQRNDPIVPNHVRTPLELEE